MRPFVKLLIIALTLLIAGLARAQEVRIGSHRIEPPRNIQTTPQGRAPLRASATANPSAKPRLLLLQFEELPSPATRDNLIEKGITLSGYLGAKAYYATLSGDAPLLTLQRAGARSLMEIQPAWKLDQALATGNIPPYALMPNGDLRCILICASPASIPDILEGCTRLGATTLHVATPLASIEIAIPSKQLQKLALLPNLISIRLPPPPAELHDETGRTLSSINPVTAPDHGLGLTGEGVRIGIWDSDIEPHTDYADRLHQQEFSAPVTNSKGHGMHVAGILAGSGALDRRAKGVATKAHLYSYNFTTPTGAASPQEKMLIARERYGISITQNSYGIYLRTVCDRYSQLSYSALGQAFPTDQVAATHPTLTHVYSVGNDQGACGREWGTTTKRAKNALLVGSVDANGNIAPLSSRGPMDDGRLAPTVVAHGNYVYSTLPNHSYGYMSGTSMATPLIAGIVALVTQRYGQLYRGEEPPSALVRALIANTADDLGNTGPDYSYGYGLANAQRAIETLNNGWIAAGNLEQGATPATHTITVPEGVAQLRVAIAWTDPVSAKEYYYGEPALINNLDLLVTDTEGHEHLPWILDPANPSQPASRGTDARNNLEQVTIDNPKQGAYSISIAPTSIPEGRQEYALVYWFERPTLQLLAPKGGESYAPGDSLLIRTTATQPYTLELSTNGGQSFAPLAANLTAPIARIPLPADMQPTGKALLRLYNNQGVALSEKPFAIIPTPSSLTVSLPECGTDNWKLSWGEIPGITAYQIATFNPNAAEPKILGEVKDAVSFHIPATEITDPAQTLLSVRAKLEDGSYGAWAPAVRSQTAKPLRLTTANLPFTESFIQYPSPYIRILAGANMRTEYNYEYPEIQLPTGGHLLHSLPAQQATDWNDTDPFATERNRTTLRICQLDLSDIPPNTPLHLRIHAIGAYNLLPEHNAFKLQIDGADYPDLAGRTIHHLPVSTRMLANGLPRQPYTFEVDISHLAGKKAQLDLIHVAKSTAERLAISNIAIFQPNDSFDIAIDTLRIFQQGNRPGTSERLEITLRNTGSKTRTNLPISYSINGSTPVIERVGELKPHQPTTYTFAKPLDLSSNEPLGALFRINATINSGDEEPQNDSASLLIVHPGDLYTLEASTSRLENGYDKGYKPRLHKAVDGKLLFAPANGAHLPYPPHQLSTVRFYPQHPGRILRIRFLRFDSEPDHDYLALYLNDVPQSLSLGSTPEAAILTGSLEEPPTFLSYALDGSISVQFVSDAQNQRAGWLAEIEEIDPINPLSISLEPLLPFYPTEKAPIQVRINNHSPLTHRNLPLSLMVDGGLIVRDTIDSLPPSQETLYTLSKPIPFPIGQERTITVSIASSADLHPADNADTLTARNDPYCRPSIQMRNEAYFTNVSIYSASFASSSNSTTSLDYYLRRNLPIYLDMQPNPPLVVSIAGAHREGLALHMAVDWNRNNAFEPNEITQLPLTPGKDRYEIPIVIPPDTKPSYYRVRLSLAPPNANPCQDLEKGDIEDYQLDLLAKYPRHYDLALLAHNLTHGRTQNTPHTLTVQIHNPSGHDINSYRIAYTHNEQPPVVEEVNDTPVPAFATVEYTFKQPLDLSQLGLHNGRIYLDINDDNAYNNSLTYSIYTAPQPANNPFFALRFHDNPDQPERLDLGTLNNASLDRGVTLEAWINLQANTSRNQVICNGKGIRLFATGDAPEGDYPPQSLVAIVNERMRIIAPANILTPGKWHHVALAINYAWIQSPANSQLYLDGVPLNVSRQRHSVPWGTASQSLTIASPFEGMIDHLRIWDVQRKQQEIVDNRYTRLEGSNHPNLIAEFPFDEGASNAFIMGNNCPAQIYSQRLASTDDPLWYLPNDLLATVSLEGQSLPALRTSENTLTVKLQPGTPRASIKGEIIPAWPGSSIFYKGQLVTKDTHFDFSSGSIQVTIEAKGIFGHDIPPKVFTITVEDDLSPDANILTLAIPAALNQGLTNDASANNPINETIALTLAGNPDLSKVKMEFSLSPGAKLFLHNQELVSRETSVDATAPLLLEVRAQNGRDSRRYTLTLLRAQTIAWVNPPTELRYGDKPLTLGATASSGMPIAYHSSNPSVATLAGASLIPLAPGETTITATQAGGQGFHAALPISHTIKVLAAQLTIAPIEQTISYPNHPNPPRFRYNGLVAQRDTLELSKPSYRILLQSGEEWKPASQLLPSGTHTLQPSATAPYEEGRYTITPAKGILQVLPTATAPVTIIIVEDGKPLPNATLTIAGIATTTNPEGIVTLDLPPDSYPLEASKEGFRSCRDTLTVERGPLTRTIALLPLQYQLRYLAEPNGTLHGHTLQQLAMGEDAQPILAIPNPGFHFTQWSDANTDNPRTERNLRESKQLTAQFAPTPFTLRYRHDNNGSLVGKTVQSVTHDATGEPVTAQPKPGFRLSHWSDLRLDNPRTDTHPTANLDVSATFARPQPIPYRQPFDSPIMPSDWLSIDQNGAGKTWAIERGTIGSLSISNSYAATINAERNGRNTHDALLISPWLSLENIEGHEVTLAFDYQASIQGDASISLQFLTDKQGWTDLPFAPYTSAYSPQRFTTTIATNGAAHLRLRWRYKASIDYQFALDNIEVSATVTCYQFLYIAEGGGSVNGQHSLAYSLNPTDTPTEVTARPNTGFRFSRWSDDHPTPARTDPKPLIAYAYFQPDLPTHALLYHAGTHGRVEGPTWQPAIPHNGNGSPVHAIPDSGFRFHRWSDERANPYRLDQGITQPLEVTALFIPDTLTRLTLTYRATEGGYLQGDTLQSLARNATGTPIEAIPHEGYSFVAWSDGQSINPRTDSNLTQDTSFTAIFQATTSIASDRPLTLWPNPATSLLRIAIPPSAEPSILRIYSTTGTVLYHREIPPTPTRILEVPVSHLPPGLYLVRLGPHRATFIRE